MNPKSRLILGLIIGLSVGCLISIDSEAQAWSSCTPPGPGQTPLQFCSCYGANQGTQDGVGLYAAWQPASESACQDKAARVSYSGAINITAAAIIEGVAATISAGNAAALPNVSPDPATNNDVGYVYSFLRGSYSPYFSPSSGGTLRSNLIRSASGEIKRALLVQANQRYKPSSGLFCGAALGFNLNLLNASVCGSHSGIVHWLDTTNGTVTPNACP